MRISNEIDYGLRAMIVIASSKEALVSSKEISKQYDIPYNFLTLILPRLVKAGIIASIQGPKGGYKLSKKETEITFYEIIKALGTSVEITSCNTEQGCELDTFCGMTSVWRKLNATIETFLKKATLAEVLMSKECFLEMSKSCSCTTAKK